MSWLNKICRGWPSYRVCHSVMVPSLLPADQPKATELPSSRANTKSSQQSARLFVGWPSPSVSHALILCTVWLCLSMWPCALVMVQYLEDVKKHSERIPACWLSIPPCCCASLCCFCCLLFGFFLFCVLSLPVFFHLACPHISGVFYKPPVIIKPHNIFYFCG